MRRPPTGPKTLRKAWLSNPGNDKGAYANGL
jgi:hypothetical protein